MTNRLHVTPLVLAWRDRTTAPLRALWERLEALGWLPTDATRVVIQIGKAYRSALSLETARSLGGFLHERTPSLTIHLLDEAAGEGEWGTFSVCDVTAGEPLCVAGVAAKRGLRVPVLWFESSYLVTVTAAHPERETRLAGVLHAQADPLRRLQNCYTPDVLMYEAHRLAASDLSIACGAASWNEPTSEPWWAVSTSDIAVDHAVAMAAGVDPMQLPVLRGLARHELLAANVELLGTLPRLRGYLAPAWTARVHAAPSRVSASRRAVAHDLAIVRRNLHKIPGFVRRQLAARRRGAA